MTATRNATAALPSVDSRRPGEAQADPALDTVSSLLDDLVNTSVLVSLFASLVNARAAGRTLIGGGPTLRQLPPPPTTALLELLLDGSSDLAPAERDTLVGARDAYVAAQRVTETVLSTPGRDVDWGPLAERWRSVATKLQAALEVAFRLEAHHSRIEQRYRRDSLMRFLGSIAAGRAPCVGARGEIVMPSWIERRREERRTMLRPVTVVRRDRRDRAATVDISRSGLGLAGVTGGVIGESITVVLERGRELQGYVAWVSNDRLGIKLLTPIADGDPLLP